MTDELTIQNIEYRFSVADGSAFYRYHRSIVDPAGGGFIVVLRKVENHPDNVDDYGEVERYVDHRQAAMHLREAVNDADRAAREKSLYRAVHVGDVKWMQGGYYPPLEVEVVSKDGKTEFGIYVLTIKGLRYAEPDQHERGPFRPEEVIGVPRSVGVWHLHDTEAEARVA
jgi:hypothetical protein